jgi:hypothetical protein
MLDDLDSPNRAVLENLEPAAPIRVGFENANTNELCSVVYRRMQN